MVPHSWRYGRLNIAATVGLALFALSASQSLNGLCTATRRIPSYFASFYFTLPILALLLGLPQILLYSYAGLALLAFTTTLGSRGGLLESAQHMELREQTSTRIRFLSALWVVSVINFCIALFVH